MKHTKTFLKWTLLMSLILFTVNGCKKKEKEETQPTTTTTTNPTITSAVYHSPNNDTNYVGLQIQIKNNDKGYTVSAYGTFNSLSHPKFIDHYVIQPKNNDTATVTILDENGLPAFFYRANTKTGIKDTILTEFEPVDSNNMYVNYYVFYWGENVGKLFHRVLVQQQGTDFVFTLQYDAGKTSNNQLLPIQRLEELINKKTGKRADIDCSNIEAEIERLKENHMSTKVLNFFAKFGAINTMEGILLAGATGGTSVLMRGAVVFGAALIITEMQKFEIKKLQYACDNNDFDDPATADNPPDNSLPTNYDIMPQTETISTTVISIAVRDYGSIDGDVISLYVNGSPIMESISIDANFYQVDNISLNTGVNELKIVSLNDGTNPPASPQVAVFNGTDWQYFNMGAYTCCPSTANILVE